MGSSSTQHTGVGIHIGCVDNVQSMLDFFKDMYVWRRRERERERELFFVIVYCCYDQVSCTVGIWSRSPIQPRWLINSVTVNHYV